MRPERLGRILSGLPVTGLGALFFTVGNDLRDGVVRNGAPYEQTVEEFFRKLNEKSIANGDGEFGLTPEQTMTSLETIGAVFFVLGLLVMFGRSRPKES